MWGSVMDAMKQFYPRSTLRSGASEHDIESYLLSDIGSLPNIRNRDKPLIQIAKNRQHAALGDDLRLH